MYASVGVVKRNWGGRLLMAEGMSFERGQNTTLSASKALSNLSIHLSLPDKTLSGNRDPSVDQICHRVRRPSSSRFQRLRTKSRSRMTSWEMRRCESWSSVMEPRTKFERSDFMSSARDRMDFMLSMRNWGSEEGGEESVDWRVLMWVSRTGAHRSRKAVRTSLRRLRVERRGDDVGGGGALRVDKMGWPGGKRGVRAW